MKRISTTFITSFLLLFSLTPISSAAAQDVCASGAGDSEWNGTYVFDGMTGHYSLDGTHYIANMGGTFWTFTDDPDLFNVTAYQSISMGDPSPDGLSYAAAGANGPAPSVASGSCTPPSPSASPSVSPSASASASASPSASITPSASPSVSPSASASASASPSAMASPSSSVTPSASPAASNTPSPSPSAMASPSASVTPSASPSAMASPSASVTPSASPAASASPSVSPSASIAPSASPSASAVASASASSTPASASASPSASASFATPSPSASTAPSPLPSPVRVPTACDSYYGEAGPPQKLCVTNLNDTKYKDANMEGTYVLSDVRYVGGKITCNISVTYNSVTNEFASITGNGSLQYSSLNPLNSNARLNLDKNASPSRMGRIASIDGTLFPGGTFETELQAPISDVPELSIFRKSVYVYVEVLEGDCSDYPPSKSRDKTSIKGLLKLLNNLQITSETSPTYALLYTGLEPSDDNQIPIDAVIVGDDGTYTFTNVEAGDYHVRFKSDDTRVQTDYVPVVAVGGVDYTISDIDAEVVAIDDEGCKQTQTTDILSELYRQNSRAKRLIQNIADLANTSLDDSKKKAKFVVRRRNRISSDSNRIENAADNALATGFELPTILRSDCPKGSNCMKDTGESGRAALTKYGRRIKDKLGRVTRISTNNTKKKQRSPLNRLIARAKKVPRKILKLASKLPKTTYTCSEVE